MDDLAWGALALTLTILGAIWTWVAFRRRGVASGLRAAAFTLLPLAAYLTRTLRMFTRIADAIGDWAASLVFSPAVWLGVVLAGISAALFVVSGFLRARQLGTRPSGDRKSGTVRGRSAKGSSGELPAAGKADTAVDPEMAEIEALLRKRGIS